MPSSRFILTGLDVSEFTTNANVATITFDTLAGTLRISTKYEIPALRQWGMRELLRRWPVDLENVGSVNSFPHAAEAINLAREVDIPSALPAAFYALSLQKWRSSTEGGRSHLVLSPCDLRRLIAGREALEEVVFGVLQDPIPLESPLCSECKQPLEQIWRDSLGPEPDMPWVHGCWLLRALKTLAVMAPCRRPTSSTRGSICTSCAEYSMGLATLRLQEVKHRIPHWFLLESQK
jgi:hypothetical protein